MRPPDEFLDLSQVSPVEIRHLWFPYIPLGKLTGMVGDPGVGKTHLAAMIAAAVSSGGILPNGGMAIPGDVIYFSVEDGFADTIVPRLQKYGADLNRIKGFREPIDIKNKRFVDLLGKISQINPRLVIFDPIQCYIGNVDMNRANEVRSAMNNLIGLAESSCCAVLMLMHMSKSNLKATYRALGSIDFVASMRSMISMGKSPDTDSVRGIMHSKSNCGPMGKSLEFDIGDGLLRYVGPSKFSEHELFGAHLDQSSSQDTLRRASEFLAAQLSSGPVERNALFANAELLGVSSRTLERAKAGMGIRSLKGPDKRYIWALPSRSAKCSDNAIGGPQEQ